jgi:WhiB family transcriptional regulator, redox-sensing transcriptional regulator
MAAVDNRAQWWSRAACRKADPELFFPISSSGTALELSRAKAICARCKVAQPCLNYALAAGPLHGIWGGTSEEERRTLMQRAEAARVSRGRARVGSLAGRSAGQ